MNYLPISHDLLERITTAIAAGESKLNQAALIENVLKSHFEPLLNGWTVRQVDYDRLASAARGLRAACRHQLPPGFYAELSPALRALDNALEVRE